MEVTVIASELQEGDTIIARIEGEAERPIAPHLGTLRVAATSSGIGGRVKIDYTNGKSGSCDPHMEFKVERESADG